MRRIFGRVRSRIQALRASPRRGRQAARRTPRVRAGTRSIRNRIRGTQVFRKSNTLVRLPRSSRNPVTGRTLMRGKPIVVPPGGGLPRFLDGTTGGTLTGSGARILTRRGVRNVQGFVGAPTGRFVDLAAMMRRAPRTEAPVTGASTSAT